MVLQDQPQQQEQANVIDAETELMTLVAPQSIGIGVFDSHAQ
jgi:hypothetical protein